MNKPRDLFSMPEKGFEEKKPNSDSYSGQRASLKMLVASNCDEIGNRWIDATISIVSETFW